MTIIETEYKGIEIQYYEHNEKFCAFIGESTYENASLSAVKKYIDKLNKKGFKRVELIYIGGGRNNTSFSPVIITSVVGNSGEGWITHKKDKSREKTALDKLALDTKENQETIATIIELEKALYKMRKKVGELESSLERYSPETDE